MPSGSEGVGNKGPKSSGASGGNIPATINPKLTVDDGFYRALAVKKACEFPPKPFN